MDPEPRADPTPAGTGQATAAIYGLVDPREPDHVRYVGSTVQSLRSRLATHLSGEAASAIREWRDEIAPVLPEIIDLAVVDVDTDDVTQGNVAEGRGHDAEYAIISALNALGHHLLNTVGHTIARHHHGTGRHQGGRHPSAMAGQRAMRTGPNGNGGGRCASPGCGNAADPAYAISVMHYESKHDRWLYCSQTCLDGDKALLAAGSL